MQSAIILMLIAMAYFIPSIVAKSRHHRNTKAIVILNIALGWTFIGWIGALIWGCTDNTLTSNAKD